MKWIYILNDLVVGDAVMPAQDIADYKKKKKVWQYSSFAPNVRKIEKGDIALIYLAGKGKRCFYAVLQIQEQIKDTRGLPTQGKAWEAIFNKIFPLGSAISNVKVFATPIQFDEGLRNEVSFIGDKKNWGLYFRQAIRSLPEADYQKIIDRKNK